MTSPLPIPPGCRGATAGHSQAGAADPRARTRSVRRGARGFSLLEMGLTLAVMSILAMAGIWGWKTLYQQADGDRPTHQLSIVELTQQQLLYSRGAFADNPSALTALEPGVTFVSGSTPATSLDGVNAISVSADAGPDPLAHTAVAYAAALSDAGVCYGIRIADPRAQQPRAEVRRVPGTFTACTADEISQGEATGWQP